MIYSVDFQDLAGKINPLEFCKYLQDLGWIEFVKIKKKDIKIFQKRDNEKFSQVKIPMNRSLIDFSEAMLNACKDIADFTQKSLERVVLELLNPLSDIIRIRIDNNKIKDGSLLFEDGLKLYDNAKKLITSTAMSLYSDNPYYKGKLPDDIQKFINNCRFGQTEIGSYVISVVCPFMKESKEGPIQLSIFNEEEDCANSITRKITSKLNKDLIRVKETIDNCQSLDRLLEGEEKININFLETLKNLNIENEDSLLEISTKWAPTISNNITNKEAINFTHDYYDVINSKVIHFKEKIEEDLKEFIGQIKTLSSVPTIEERSYGIIKLVTLVNKKPRVISIKLNKEDYQQAILAHKNGVFVRVKGFFEYGNILKCVEYETMN